MTQKRIFMTGASGCIGHYIADKLIKETQHELFLLVRNPAKIKFAPESRPGIHILHADFQDIEKFEDLLKTINIVIHTAAIWGGMPEVFDINVAKTIRLFSLVDQQVCEQIFYFSTASVLDYNLQPLEAAKQIGTDYIKAKYDCLTQLPRLDIAEKITVLFPTLVFGGDETKPYSHISAGLKDAMKWVSLARFFTADASFHFIHGEDIARVTCYLVDNPLPYDVVNEVDDIYLKQLVLGSPPVKVHDAVREISHYRGKRVYFQINLSRWLANFFIALFRIQMESWDRFCLEYRHFVHKTWVNPTTFGLPMYCPTLSDILKERGVRDRRK
ncbi:NAD(P)-dependent oxidoreductase [Spirulina sp. CS-785/01]|uniref:NAD-dependent epimerase/dehydratase family protein n=1 Tax=Spirulina sp. CS-785/01 TaxID=3021716 RepID=UPI00232E9D8B|nr:NAD(P)-dependent oxidoreductase [Spirulina sp. CS-785/01]MDB9312400.1 NAD(P)-dependent oxidoreductase [Spirulina sp. CS-785/01]